MQADYAMAGEFNSMALMAAIIMGIIFGFMIRSWLINSMSNVRPAVEAMDYLKRETVKMIVSRDTYLFTNVSRVPKVQQQRRESRK